MVGVGEEIDDARAALTDELARLTVAADADPDPAGEAATALARLWVDPRVNPRGQVLTFTPLEPGADPRLVDLTARPAPPR